MIILHPHDNFNGAFRQPTGNQRDYIAGIWYQHLNGWNRPRAATLALTLGIGALVLLLLDLLLLPTAITDKVLLSAATVSCLSTAKRWMRRTRHAETLQAMLAGGRFCVLPATAESVRMKGGKGGGYVRVTLDGGRTYGEYLMTYEEASRMATSNMTYFPVLLIKLEGERQLLASLDCGL